MRRCVGVLVLTFFAGLANAPGTLVDWSTQTWTPGTLSNSFDVDPGNPGNDVTVTVSGDTAQLQTSLASPNPQTPAITQGFWGGTGSARSTLELAVDLTNNTQSITVTINFSNLYSAGVANVSLQLFDIDFANGGGSTYQDVIRSISATSTTGTPIAPTITNLGANVSLSGTGLVQVLTGMASTPDTGPSSGGGNATISVNATDISSLTFTYASSTMFLNPTYQHIGIYNIDYSVVPEAYPTWFSLIFCGSLIAWTTFRRLKNPARKQAPRN